MQFVGTGWAAGRDRFVGRSHDLEPGGVRMARDAGEFWRALERRLPEDELDREREIARSVLILLRHRLLPEEAQHLKREFPEEMDELWAMRGIGVAEEHGDRAVVDLDHNWFLTGVKDMADLPDMEHAARATAAVFGAVREIISDTESRHVEQQLPAGLKELWRGDHGKPGPHFPEGESPYWRLLADRLEGRVAASETAITCSVLAHLRGRLPAGLVDRIHAALPPDLQDDWVAPEAGAEADEAPERFVGRVAQDLGLTDLDDARHATAAAMGAFRRALPDELREWVARELPDELSGMWEGM